jgi:hypothetical protein|tara:strand:+ start:103 stop:867 length:765 start_codon:yes stop_codon:yes gene_type:complete
MAINFPNSPSLNDTHTVNGVIYTWDGTAWVTSSGVDTFELVQDLTPMLGGDLDGNSKNIRNVGVLTAGNVTVGGGTTDLLVSGDARVTGILTVGSSSLTLDGSNNTVQVGTALTLGHTQGFQFHTQNLHATGFEVNQVNASQGVNVTGIVTATTLKGSLDSSYLTGALPALDGSSLTGIQGLAEPLSNTAPLNKFLKTPKTINIGAGTSLTIENNDAASDNLVFVKEGTIHVSVGGTFRVKQNTKLRLDVLGLF